MLNTILLHGNDLYTFIANSVNKDLLLLTDVPEMVCINDTVYNLQYRESYAGEVLIPCNNEPYFTLQSELHKIFLLPELNYTFALLTVGCNTVAIFKMLDRSFRIFDSHAIDLFGVPSPFGKCILIAVTRIENLAKGKQNFIPIESIEMESLNANAESFI